MSKTQTPPSIENIPLADLVIDETLSGRTSKEIKDNAKEKKALMLASGGWDASYPAQYFVRDGKKHLVAGFSRVEAASQLEIKKVPAIEIPDDPIKNRLKCVTSNAGRPISPWHQGKAFAELRDGILKPGLELSDGQIKDGEAMRDATNDDYVVAPMSQSEIAEASGYTAAHVSARIVVFESPEEIGAMVLDGKISANVVTAASQKIKSEAKLKAALKDAARVAKEEGKECATMKHWDAVKSNHIEPPKLKAATTTPPATDEQKPTKKGDESGVVLDLTAPPATETEPQPDAELPMGESEPIQQPETSEDLPEVPPDLFEKHGKLVALFLSLSEELMFSASDEDAHRVAYRILTSGIV